MLENTGAACTYCAYVFDRPVAFCPRCGTPVSASSPLASEAVAPSPSVPTYPEDSAVAQARPPSLPIDPQRVVAAPAAAPAAAASTSPPEPDNEPLITAARVKRTIPFVVAAVVAAVALWFAIGAFSLLIDLVLVLWLAGIMLTGQWWMRRGDLVLAGIGAGLAVVPMIKQRKFNDRAVLQGVALMLAPLAVGLVCGFGALVTHSSTDDVCSAYADFVAADRAGGTGYFDNKWFNALDKVGAVAEDSADDYVRNAGSAARTVAQGHGGGPIRTAGAQEAYNALGPINGLCIGWVNGSG